MTRIGDPLDDGTLYGPMHSKVGVEGYKKSIEEAVATGGKIEFGGKVINQYNFLVYLLFVPFFLVMKQNFRENISYYFFYHDVHQNPSVVSELPETWSIISCLTCHIFSHF